VRPEDDDDRATIAPMQAPEHLPPVHLSDSLPSGNYQ
jgi:hypothetical protein